MSDYYEFPTGIPPGMVPKEESSIDRYGSSWKVIRRDVSYPEDETLQFWDSLPEEVKKTLRDNIERILRRRLEEEIRSFLGDPVCLCPSDGVYAGCPVHRKGSPR